MKIAIIRHTIRNRGSDNAFFNYADYLIRHGHEVFYYTSLRQTDLAFNPAIQFEAIPYKGALGTIFFVLISKFSEDIVAIDLIPLACLSWIRNKKKLVYLARGYDVSYFTSGFLRHLVKILYKLALCHMKIPVVSVSESLTTTLKQFSPLRILTAPNGVDTQWFQKKSDQKSFIKSDDTKVIVFHYRDEYVKGSDVGLKALAQLAKRRKGWELWIIGEKLPQKHMPPGITTTNYGFLNHEKLRDALSAADIFLLPSRSEGMSPLLLQALSCECAVVATRASSIITHGIDGLIAEVEDWNGLASAMERLLDNEPLEYELKKNGRELAQRYNMENSCRSFEKALVALHNLPR